MDILLAIDLQISCIQNSLTCDILGYVAICFYLIM